jgi:hypothetical protein
MTPTREIRLPGEGLLPPSTKPLPPADIRPNERVRVIPPCPPWQPQTKEDLVALSKDPNLPQLDRRYWRMQDAFEDQPRGLIVAWKNDPGTGAPRYGSGYGVGRLPDVSVFEVKPEEAGLELPDFFQGNGLFAVSTRLLEILLEADADAIVHKPILFVDAAGTVFDDHHHYIDVVRNVEAVDFANSVVDYDAGDQYEGEDLPWISLGYVSSRMVDLDPQIKIFRQKGLYGGGRSCFVTDDLKQRIEAVSPPIRNVAFHPLYTMF